MRGRKFVKFGIYAYVLLLFAGVSYALFEPREEIFFEAEVHLTHDSTCECPTCIYFLSNVPPEMQSPVTSPEMQSPAAITIS